MLSSTCLCLFAVTSIAPFVTGCIPVAADNVLYLTYVLLMVFETSTYLPCAPR